VERQDLDQLFSVAYEELRRLAATVGRHDPSATLSPTALVHEAWLRLAGSPPAEVASPLHFKRIAARAMRHVLVDAARRRNAQKRGADVAFVTFDDALHGGASTADDVLALDEALERLAAFSPRQASMVEYRFFGGFDASQTAELLNVSEATVLRDWRAARAWLAQDLRRAD
jgi:RNA polymerase sigma factor (TIGR02999 family)